jgi:hypothetical protein
MTGHDAIGKNFKPFVVDAMIQVVFHKLCIGFAGKKIDPAFNGHGKEIKISWIGSVFFGHKKIGVKKMKSQI